MRNLRGHTGLPLVYRTVKRGASTNRSTLVCMVVPSLSVPLQPVARVPSLSLPAVPSQEVLEGEAGPPFHLAALRAFTAAEFMEENIDFLLEVMESDGRVQCALFCWAGLFGICSPKTKNTKLPYI